MLTCMTDFWIKAGIFSLSLYTHTHIFRIRQMNEVKWFVSECFACLSDLSRWRPLPPLERVTATSESVTGQLFCGVFQTPRDTDWRPTGAGQWEWWLAFCSNPAQASLQPNMQTPPLHPPHSSYDGFSWASAWTTPLDSDWLIGSRKESELLGDTRTSGGTWTISFSWHHEQCE